MMQLNEPLDSIVSLDDLINKKLTESISSKKEERLLRFSEPLNKELDSNPSTIDLSRFGLKNPNDIKIFLLSPAGETLTHEIGAELMRERAIEEEKQLQMQEQIMIQERRRALLFHWLLGEEEESKKAQDELIQMQQEKTLKSNEQNAQKKTPPEPNQATKDTIEGYTKAIEQLEKDQEILEQRSKKLEVERKMINEKHDAYDKGLEKFDAARFEINTEEDIRNEIKKLQKEADETADKMMAPGVKDEEVQRLGNHLNTLSLKIASLEDILAAKRKNKKDPEKVFADLLTNIVYN